MPAGPALSVAEPSIGACSAEPAGGRPGLGFARCYQCELALSQAGGLLADAVAPIGYAVRGGPLAEDLRRYKSDRVAAAEARGGRGPAP